MVFERTGESVNILFCLNTLTLQDFFVFFSGREEVSKLINRFLLCKLFQTKLFLSY